MDHPRREGMIELLEDGARVYVETVLRGDRKRRRARKRAATIEAEAWLRRQLEGLGKEDA